MKRRHSENACQSPPPCRRFPTIVSASALGRQGAVAPSEPDRHGRDRFRHAGHSDMESFLSKDEVQFVAVCDLDEKNLQTARDIVNKKLAMRIAGSIMISASCASEWTIDAISIAIPDHWHAMAAVLGARAGKDMYGEKPFAHSLREGRIMADTIKRYGRVWQTGSWQRSTANFYQAVAIVRSGRIGKVKSVEVGLPSGITISLKHRGTGSHGASPRRIRLRSLARTGPVEPLLPGRVHVRTGAGSGLRRRPAHGLGRPPPRHRPLGHGLRHDRTGGNRRLRRIRRAQRSGTARSNTA